MTEREMKGVMTEEREEVKSVRRAMPGGRSEDGIVRGWRGGE